MEIFTAIYNGRGRGDGYDAEVYHLRPNEVNQPGCVGFVVLLKPVGRTTVLAQWADTEKEALHIARYGQPGDSFDWEKYCQSLRLRPRA